MKVKVRPVGDRVLLERLKVEARRGQIIIPDSAKEKPTKAKVIAVGEGAVTEEGVKVPLELKVGETVIIGKYSGTEVKIEGKEYVIAKESDVMAVCR